jgi:hypothetical protein
MLSSLTMRPPVWRFLSSYAFDPSDFRNLRIFKPHRMIGKASILIVREVRKSFDPGIANFANGILAAAACLMLAACASPDPVSYKDIASASYLRPNPKDEAGHIPYIYAQPVDWRSYSKAVIDPVEIYRGPDNQFGDMSQDDRAELAAYMQAEFSKALMSRFTPASQAGPGTLRIKLTLTGAETNTAVLSTFTRFDIAGALYNGVQAVRGHEGLMTGSVLYVVELYDGASNRLLEAFVTKQYPGAYNIGAGIGSLAAAKTGLDKGAEALAEHFH